MQNNKSRGGFLSLTRRKQRGNAITISGTLYQADGTKKRVQKRADSHIWDVALQEANAIETAFYEEQYHGPKSGPTHWTFGDAVQKYLDEEPRNFDTKDRLDRLMATLGADTLLAEIGQDSITKLRNGLFKGRAEATILRGAITPITAVLTVAEDHGMIDRMPKLKRPKIVSGRTAYFTPEQAERLIANAADHLKGLLIFLFCTGARLSEALYLPWQDVNLKGNFAFFPAERTKKNKDRNVDLPPRVVAALANLKHRDGMVFRKPDGEPYALNITKDGRQYGGQIDTAFHGARRRAGLPDELTPHNCRHTWASWYYRLHLDLLQLQEEGGWADLGEVQRYTHRMFAGHEQEIATFFGLDLRNTAAVRRGAVQLVVDNEKAVS